MFLLLYVIIVVVIPIFFSIKWNHPRECDLVYLLSVKTIFEMKSFDSRNLSHVLFLFQFEYIFFVVFFHVSLTAISTLYLYIRIFMEAFHQLRTRDSLPNLLNREFATGSHEKFKNRPHLALRFFRLQQLKKETKTAKTMAIILGVHLLSLMPYLVVITWGYLMTENAASSQYLSDAKKVCLEKIGRSGLFGMNKLHTLFPGDRRLLLWQVLPEPHHLWLEE